MKFLPFEVVSSIFILKNLMGLYRTLTDKWIGNWERTTDFIGQRVNESTSYLPINTLKSKSSTVRNNNVYETFCFCVNDTLH